MMSRLFPRNVGKIDRVIRALPSLVVLWAWWQGVLTGTPLIAASVFAVSLLVSGLMGSCSIYAMLGWSTCPRDGGGPRN